MSDHVKKLSKSVCPVCKKIFEWKSGLSRHLRTVHTSSKRRYKCNNCNRSFLTLFGLNVHQRVHSKDVTEERVTGEKKKISEIYKNIVSETLYSSDSDCEYELLQTIIKVNSYRNCTYSCQHCDKKFIKNISLKRHILKSHKNEPDNAIQATSVCEMESPKSNNEMEVECLPEDNMQVDKDSIDDMDLDNQEIITIKTTPASIVPDISENNYYCTICNANFKELSSLTNHRKLHLKQSVVHKAELDKRRYNCQLCNRRYSQKIYLENHMRLHTSGKLYEMFEEPTEDKYLCTFCGKQFGYSSHLSVHTKLHVDGKKHLCSYCGKAFALRRYLINHQKIHTQEKQFICKYCDKRFIHKATLVEHQRIHEGIKPYECTICNKMFTHYSGLAQHLQTHTDEKKYVCNVCGKGFRFGGHYRGHMRTHTGDKPFTCNICARSFALRGSLVVHLRIHSGERPYKCDVCQKGFIKSYNLKQHVKRHAACKEKPNDSDNKNVFIPQNKNANSY